MYSVERIANVQPRAASQAHSAENVLAASESKALPLNSSTQPCKKHVLTPSVLQSLCTLSTPRRTRPERRRSSSTPLLQAALQLSTTHCGSGASFSDRRTFVARLQQLLPQKNALEVKATAGLHFPFASRKATQTVRCTLYFHSLPHLPLSSLHLEA